MKQKAKIRFLLVTVFAFAGASFSQVRAEGNAWESAYKRYRFAVDVGGGKTLCVESEAPGEASRAVELNGRKLEGVKISHADVMKGGTLRFVGGESRGR